MKETCYKGICKCKDELIKNEKTCKPGKNFSRIIVLLLVRVFGYDHKDPFLLLVSFGNKGKKEKTTTTTTTSETETDLHGCCASDLNIAREQAGDIVKSLARMFSRGSLGSLRSPFEMKSLSTG